MRAHRAAFGIGTLWATLALTLAAALTARAQSQPLAVQAVQVVHAFQDAWNSGRVERVLPLLADDAVIVDSRESASHATRSL